MVQHDINTCPSDYSFNVDKSRSSQLDRMLLKDPSSTSSNIQLTQK